MAIHDDAEAARRKVYDDDRAALTADLATVTGERDTSRSRVLGLVAELSTAQAEGADWRAKATAERELRIAVEAELAACQGSHGARRLSLGVNLKDQSRAAWEAFVAKHPEVSVERIFHPPGNNPATYATSFAAGRPVGSMLSFKPAIADLIAGRHAAWTKTFADSCPDPVDDRRTFLAFQHEPEQAAKGISAADFVAASTRWMRDLGEHPKVHRTLIPMEYQWAAQGTNYHYLDVDPSLVDCIAPDFYNGLKTSKTLQQLCEPMFTWLRNRFPDALLGIGELGCSTKYGIDRGKWLADGLAWLESFGVDNVFYFHNASGNNETTWPLTDAEWTAALANRS